MDGAATALMSGAAASRSWGHGAIQWTPSSVSARVYVHARPPAHRRVRVSTTHTDEEGRLKKSEVTLEAEATWQSGLGINPASAPFQRFLTMVEDAAYRAAQGAGRGRRWRLRGCG